MADSDPYRAPAPEEPNDSHSPFASQAGLASLVLTILALLIVVPVDWPLSGRGVLAITVCYGSALGLNYIGFRAGGLANLTCGGPAAIGQVYLFMEIFVM